MIASTASMRFAIGALLVLAPFHFVEVFTITNSTAMAYMVVAGIMLRGSTLKLPLLGSMLLVLLGYLISTSQVDPSLYRLHGPALIMLVSGFIVFVLGYNLARTVEDPRSVVNLVIVANLVVNAYCLIQLIVGPGLGASVLGFEAFSIEVNRGEGDPRLGGPFGGAPGILAQYLALVTLVIVYDAMHSDRGRRIKLWFLVAANFGLIIATANRGGFITLIVGVAGYLLMFRKELGTIRVIQVAIAGFMVLAIISVLVIKLTDFNVMFERLETVTETTEGGVPETRQAVWPQAWERFKQVPWFGQGPMWQLPEERHGVPYPGRVFLEYPHSLYLYLLVSVGIVGTCAFAVYFLNLGMQLLRSTRAIRGRTGYLEGLVRLGPLILFLFLLDQIRIEFLRQAFSDYQHVVFGLLGMWLGLAHRAVAVAEPVPTVADDQSARRASRRAPDTAGGLARIGGTRSRTISNR
ncbi:MAG: O-antigen ligase family protein [Steroidobacteraceae bacterium]